MQRDRRRVAERADVERHRVGHLEHALDRLHNVLGVRALGVMAVLAVTEVLATVVETQVVPAGTAHPAVATSRVRRSGHTRPGHEPVFKRDPPRAHDLAGPLVSGRERVGLWPAALEGALDDLGARAADHDRPDAAESLLLLRLGLRDVADLERVRRRQDQGLHGYVSVNATTRQMQPSPFTHRQGNAPMSTRLPATSASSPPRFSSIGMFAFAMW